ncbi:MAG: 3-oxoacyl-ACP reductase [Bradyrhizobium sp.]|nr:3-oxoacyl-ACP reductase [Bradyrhizobium sp.]
MDLGLNGKTAIVCASTRGLGRACAEALLAEGVRVVINGRHAERTEAVAHEFGGRWPGRVIGVTGDVTTTDGRSALLDACPDPDILVNNNAGPEPGAFSSFDEAIWLDALNANMVAPLMLVRAVLPAMRKRQFGRIVNITSAMVTTPRPLMALSSGARAGLTAALKGLLLEVARENVTFNNLLPERFDTDRQAKMAKAAMERDGVSWDEARARQTRTIPARRLGEPAEFGATCAFVCSVQASYMTGMNIRLDGGSYPALL